MPTLLNPDYRLTIQFALGGLSFALFEADTLTLADMELHQSDSLDGSEELFLLLEKDLGTRDLNDVTFQSVTCLIDGRTHTLVPESLYDAADSDRLLGFGFDVPDSFVTGSDYLDTLRAHNLYGYPASLRDRILTKWPEADIKHSSTAFLKSLTKSETPTVHVNVRNRDFDMAIMQDQLLFFNNFKFQTKADFTYYLLFAMQQHGLSGLDTTVNFTGLIQPSSEIIDLCHRYLKDIRFVARPQDLKLKETLRDVPFQYYHNHYQILK